MLFTQSEIQEYCKRQRGVQRSDNDLYNPSDLTQPLVRGSKPYDFLQTQYVQWKKSQDSLLKQCDSGDCKRWREVAGWLLSVESIRFTLHVHPEGYIEIEIDAMRNDCDLITLFVDLTHEKFAFRDGPLKLLSRFLECVSTIVLNTEKAFEILGKLEKEKDGRGQNQFEQRFSGCPTAFLWVDCCHLQWSEEGEVVVCQF
jgi:hypothetical protein